MNIKYNKKKEALRKDPVMEYFLKIIDTAQKNSNSLISGLVVLILIVAGIQIFSFTQKSTLGKAQDSFGKAMILYNENSESDAIEMFTFVVDNFKKTQVAAYSAYMLGHINLAKEEYKEAIAWFETASNDNGKTGFIPGGSLEALATCYEAEEELDRALEYFEKALGNKMLSFRYPAIRWKMALINKKLGNKDKVEFYCNEIVSDTLAINYKKKAENLLVSK